MQSERLKLRTAVWAEEKEGDVKNGNNEISNQFISDYFFRLSHSILITAHTWYFSVLEISDWQGISIFDRKNNEFICPFYCDKRNNLDSYRRADIEKRKGGIYEKQQTF